MTTITRILAVLAFLAAVACGNGSEDTRAGAAPADTDPVSTFPADVAGAHDRDGESLPAAAPWSAPAPTVTTPASSGEPPTTSASAVGDEPLAGPSAYAAPPGRYVYDVSGTVQTDDLTGSSERPVPPTSTDDIRVSESPAAMRMTVITRDEGQDSSQEIVVAVTATEARLVRLGHRPGSGLDYSVNPDPPALLAQLPYRDGDTWEIAWNDPSTGISGVGTGTVERRETITTPAGRFDTVVVTVTQRLRGTVTGTLTVTSWIDPVTGVQPRQHVVTDLANATGASRTDSIRTLRERPG